MPDGKLHIKGTITIKTSKGTKKKRKPRKKKTTKEPYTGVPLGTAETKQEFGSPTYTAQALMTAMSLRPQLSYPSEQFKSPQIQQPEITYSKFEELPKLGYDVPVVTTRREFEQKAVPFLETSIRQGIEEQRKILEEQTYQTEQQMRGLETDFMKKQQFFENEMETKQKYFQKELADLELRAKSEKERLQLERIQDKAEFIAESVIDKGLFNIQSAVQKQQLKQQEEELKQAKEKIKETEIEGAIKRINVYGKADAEQYLKIRDPEFSIINLETGEPKSLDELRKHILKIENLSQYARPVKSGAVKGRPTIKYEYQPIREVQETFDEE